MARTKLADFDDVATFCTMRLFERAENPELYRFPPLYSIEPDDRDESLTDYAMEKLSLPKEKAEEFRSQFDRFHRYFGVARERRSYNLVLLAAVIRWIWETKAVEALRDILVHFRDKRNLDRLVDAALALGRQEYCASKSLGSIAALGSSKSNREELKKRTEQLTTADTPFDYQIVAARNEPAVTINNMTQRQHDLEDMPVIFGICVDAAEFSVAKNNPSETIVQIRLHPDRLATRCRLECTETVCLHCATTAALNEESGNFFNGFDPSSCRASESFMELFSSPAAPEYQSDSCVTCSHARAVHYNAVSVLGCGSCDACLRHSAELWDQVAKVANIEISESLNCPADGFNDVDPPSERIKWTTMPLLTRKIILAQALGPIGSILYSHLCEELVSALRLLSAPQVTAQDAPTMDSRPSIPGRDADDSTTIDAPVPRLLVLMLENGYFGRAYDMIRSKYVELCDHSGGRRPTTKTKITFEQVLEFQAWLEFVNRYFSHQPTALTGVIRSQSASPVIMKGFNIETHLQTRAGEADIYSVEKKISAEFVLTMLKFMEFAELAAVDDSALTIPAIAVNLAFSTIQGAQALSIVKFRMGKMLGKGSFGEVYEVKAGSLRLALKIIDLKRCHIQPRPSLESMPSSIYAPILSSWIDLSHSKMYILMPRFTTNLADYIESKKRHLTSDRNDISKITTYRVIAAHVLHVLLVQLTAMHGVDLDYQLIHGDIHARNVFLSHDENEAISDVALGDFGLSHIQETEPTEPSTTDQSWPNESGSGSTPVDSDTTSTPEGYDLANLRSNVIRYMLKDIREHLSVEELRLCGWQTRGPDIGFTAEEMRTVAVEAVIRTSWEFSFINVFLPQENMQVLEESLPHVIRPGIRHCKIRLNQMSLLDVRTESTGDQVKACLEAARRKQDDMGGLMKSIKEVLLAQIKLYFDSF